MQRSYKPYPTLKKPGQAVIIEYQVGWDIHEPIVVKHVVAPIHQPKGRPESRPF
ncbi:MAG: hypothetical protein RIE86_09190 [Imperialibacter sp.]|uniref:hypothetical protein n=1 Tax=Imperialibacter sp. TaxID=2038411 RepID=UPI0032EECF70